MALHAVIFPCKINANNLINLHSISQEFTIIIEDLRTKSRIPEYANLVDIPNIQFLFRSLLELKCTFGLNFNSFALQTLILKISYLICILTKESESLNVLESLRLLEILDRIKHIYQTSLSEHLTT